MSIVASVSANVSNRTNGIPRLAEVQRPDIPDTDVLAAVPAPNHGEVFTQPWVVELILQLAGYTPDRDLADLLAVEPACGSGAFLAPMAKRLSESCRRYGRDLVDAADAVYAVDLQEDHVEAAKVAVAKVLLHDGWSLDAAEAIAEAWVHGEDFLLDSKLSGRADFVLGNPPYVRLEEVDPKKRLQYRRSCTTMGGRADLFVGGGSPTFKPPGRCLETPVWRLHFGFGGKRCPTALATAPDSWL